jgi:hypothetical protein
MAEQRANDPGEELVFKVMEDGKAACAGAGTVSKATSSPA